MRGEAVRLAKTHRRELDTLAQAWLVGGARGVWLLASGYVLGQWGLVDEGAASNCATFTVPLANGRSLRLDWCVAVDETAGVRARLDAEAGLLARLFAVEAETGQILDELVATRDQLLAIMDLSRFTRAYLEVEPMLRIIINEAQGLLQAESSFAIGMLPGNKTVMLHFPQKRQVRALGAYLYKQVRAANSHVVMDGDAVPHSFVNALMVPVYVQGQIAAGLGFFDSPYGFDAPAVKMAGAIAELAGERLENILLYQENISQARLSTEMELAWDVQAKLIPGKIPAIAGLDLYATYKPALQVGGDFYDFIPRTSKDGYTFVLGDVSGKGMSAAMVMTMMHTALRTAANRDDTPAEVIARVNGELYDDFTEISVFSTLFAAQCTADGLRYANAGHSPVLYCTANGDCRLLVADGTAVGILPESFCVDQPLPLAQGDVLVIATDGFSEAENSAGALFGYDRLCAEVTQNRHLSAEGIAHALLNAIERFSHGSEAQSDDQTILVIKKTGTAT